jgi:HD-like signal output (HDOD) protein
MLSEEGVVQKVPIGQSNDAPPWAHLRIPPFPQIAIRVLQMANNPDVSMRKLSDLISTDPAFSSEVLTIVNSPLYATRSPSNSVLHTIAVLGTDSLKGICLTVGVRAYLGKSLRQESLRAIWRHSLACGLIAQQLAAAGSMSKDASYTAGVMHDIGRLALAVIRPKEYAALIMAHSGSPSSMLKCERDLFGFDHCEAGRHLIADWKLPAEFEAVVSDHHCTRQKEGPWRLPDLIKMSCRMADTIGFSTFPGCEVTPYADLLGEMPERERATFHADMESLAFEVSSKINALELT